MNLPNIKGKKYFKRNQRGKRRLHANEEQSLGQKLNDNRDQKTMKIKRK